jgi:lipoprotein-anchoring transpeptidase ErfK/SrfK
MRHQPTPQKMPSFSRILSLSILLAAVVVPPTLKAQVEIPRTAATAGRDDFDDVASAGPSAAEALADESAPLALKADLGSRTITVTAADKTVRTYKVAVGRDKYPTPVGSFKIQKIVWNPSWRPPDSKWAQGKSAKGPGDPGNPMKVVKIFFQDPDYYIHGTDDVDSLGDAASHGCLRMAPDDVADLAKMIMEHGGQPHDENWFWRILHSRREEKVVYLDNPISLTITD